jgi:hypothetical protein
MEFKVEQTNVAKGVAICLMFVHHLFSFPDRILNGNTYISLLPFLTVERSIANFGGICVSMFLFLSGYGMFLGHLRSQKGSIHYSLSKLKEFYFTYWRYFLIFIPIGLIFFKDVTLWQSDQPRFPLEPVNFLKNFAGWSSTYNEEWWFVRVFLPLLILIFPLYSKLAEKNITLLITTSIGLFFIQFNPQVNSCEYLDFLYCQPSFATGIVFAKLKLFSKDFTRQIDAFSWMYITFGVIFCVLIRRKFGSNYDFLITPFFVYFSIRIVKTLRLTTLFRYLGRYSFQLWLTHSFFCYYYFQAIVYSPRWVPLIFIVLTVMSLLSVLGIEYLYRFLQFKDLVERRFAIRNHQNP